MSDEREVKWTLAQEERGLINESVHGIYVTTWAPDVPMRMGSVRGRALGQRIVELLNENKVEPYP